MMPTQIIPTMIILTAAVPLVRFALLFISPPENLCLIAAYEIFVLDVGFREPASRSLPNTRPVVAPCPREEQLSRLPAGCEQRAIYIQLRRQRCSRDRRRGFEPRPRDHDELSRSYL